MTMKFPNIVSTTQGLSTTREILKSIKPISPELAALYRVAGLPMVTLVDLGS